MCDGSAAIPLLQRPVVLIVDDEPEILRALSDTLEEDYEVLSETSAEQALGLLQRRGDVAVIISDQRMRGMPGDEFLARARGISDAGTILLTGYADFETVISALNKGAITFYVAKPWIQESLRAMVREASTAFRTRQELRTERMLLRGAFDHLPVGLTFCDAEGRFMRLNARAAEVVGQAEAFCIGRTEEELLPESRKNAARAAEEEFRSEGKSSRIDHFTDETGRERWHRLTRTRLPGEGEQQTGLSILIHQDMSDLMEMALRLRHVDKMQAVGTLAGGIAHDFNNLLTAILGSLELLPDLLPQENAPAQRLMGNAVSAARKGAQLTRRLLDFSRPGDVVRTPVAIPDLLKQLQGLLNQTVNGHGTRSETPVTLMPFPEELPAASTDAGQLELALVNLCLNARDALPQGGEIRISTGFEHVAENDREGGLQAGDYVVISVTDGGIGMSPELQSRIFEPFFTTKHLGGGSGLGLPMIYGFVRRNGGDVRVVSAPGEGTSITLWLPAAEIPAAARPETADRGDPFVVKGQTILVVDDDPGVGIVTEGFLRRAGFTVLRCENGQDALLLVQQRPEIRCVVMDLLMPGMNGDECARRISEIRQEMSILFVTGFADRAALPEGARVLGKPFSSDALLAGVKAMMPE
ncbi:response regulator [Acetobacter sp. AN02]|uniref:response regulator n=1 Tax=Acetobacter sp. AN02 TaxID=2894186 RepID=UPI002434445A|nr:response regulator [Acetobacter sp. AN02]MDG6094536.1 response regulator [Acetobacter sp. AN02]